MPIRAIARLIQTMLYARRFFPYYVYNILGGIEEDGTSKKPNLSLQLIGPGTGAVYSFDPVGSYEREACRAAGAAQALLQPFLDNQVSCYSLYDPVRPFPDLYPISIQIKLTRFTDLLQESDSCPWHFPSYIPAASAGACARDRLFHKCNRETYRGPHSSNFVCLCADDIQVGDGLEIYISLSKSFPIPSLQGLQGIQEVTATRDGERIFVLRRDLKKD